MLPRPLRLALALAGCLVVAPAAAASAATSPAYPAIKAVAPLKLGIGDTMTIAGSGFIKGKKRNTVVFKRDGQRAIFVLADSATTSKITLKIPDKLLPFLSTVQGKPVLTRFRVRVLARRFGRRFTALKSSPLIGPVGTTTAPPTTPTTDPCQKAIAANPSGDFDSDGLSNALEKSLGTNPCNPDTDGDGMTDGWEYESALDLNSRAVPYPASRPYTNPLDPNDGNIDHDGDGLTAAEEFAAWKYTDGTYPVKSYSDGTQTSGGPMPAPAGPAAVALDMNQDGFLTDDEKDADGDGINNWDEIRGRMTQGWWSAFYSSEVPFNVAPFSGTNFLNPDTDGDGIPDGLDDQDHDGWTNLAELSRTSYWVNPYNPCLPDYNSRTCPLHPPMTSPYAPFPLPDPPPPTPLVWPQP